MVCGKQCSEGHTFVPPCDLSPGQGDMPTLDDALVAMHEWFVGLRKAGFGRMEALWLTGVWSKGVPMPDWLYDMLEAHKPWDDKGGV